MRVYSRWISAFALSCAVALHAPGLHAQGWIQFPNGELGYVTDYTTTGIFRCGDPFFMLGTCQASGNTITIGSNGNFMTMMFAGLTNVITATNSPQRYAMGTITKTFSGPGAFTFPQSTNVNVPLFYFSMLISTSVPLAAAVTWDAGYLPTSLTSIPRNCCSGFSDDVVLPIAPPPAPFTYNGLVWNSFTGTTMSVDAAAMSISANAAIIPEPATLLLTASGLLGMFSVMGYRRRRSAEDA